MAVLLRAILICDGCGKTIHTVGEPGTFNRIWWRLPAEWLITSDRPPHGVYCKYACIDPKYRAATRAVQTGKPTEKPSYTLDTTSALGMITEILDAPDQDAGRVLAAIHALLDAFQKKANT